MFKFYVAYFITSLFLELTYEDDSGVHVIGSVKPEELYFEWWMGKPSIGYYLPW